MLKKIIELPYTILEYIWKKIVVVFKFLFVEEKDGKADLGATFKGVLIALVLALIIRSFLYEPFYIPSGSMKPGLKDGDFIIVSKYDYGYSRYSFPFGLPFFSGRIFFNKDKLQRGDVLVFRLPRDPSINYIKRLIGLPGDKIQMKDGKLYVNDKEISKTYIEEIEEYDEIPESKVKAFREVLDNGKEVVGVATSLEGEYLLVISKNGYGKMSLITDYRLTKRGSQGVLTMKISEKNGLLSNIKAVNGTEDLLVVTNQGIVIRTSLEQVKKAGRNTLGVRIIKLNEGQEVSSIAIAAKEEIIETEDEQEKCST